MLALSLYYLFYKCVYVISWEKHFQMYIYAPFFTLILSMKNRGSIINRGSEVVGVRQTELNHLYETRAKKKDIKIVTCVTSCLSIIIQLYATMRQETESL